MTSHSGAQGSVPQTDPFSVYMVNLGKAADGPLCNNIETLSADLRQAGLAVTWSRDGNLKQALGGDYNKILVFVPALEHAVAGMIGTGVSPSQALEVCLAKVEDTLKLYRRNRRKICLIETSHFAHAEELMAAVSQHLGLAEVPKGTKFQKLKQAGPLMLTLAAQSVAASVAAGTLKGELEASSLAVGDAQTIGDADAAFAVVQDIKAQAAAARQAAKKDDKGKMAALEASVTMAKSAVRSKEKVLNEAFDKLQTQETQLAEAQGIKDLLVSQLKAVQQELETHFSAANEQGAQRAGLETELVAINKKLQMARAEMTELHARDAAQTQRLAETTKQLKDTTDKLDETQGKLAEAQALLESYAHEMEAFKDSTSWKLTKPLRRVKDTMTPGKS